MKLAFERSDYSIATTATVAASNKDAKYAEPAPIGLQIHGGLVMKVEFRDLRALAL